MPANNDNIHIPLSPTKLWWLAVRPKTLTASVSPVLVGSLAAYPQFNSLIFMACLACAIALQITVNFANDYFDHKSGVDTDQRIGPQRASASGLINPTKMLFAIKLMLLLSSCFGILLIAHGGWWFLLLGIFCLLAALAYSGGPYPLASHGLGEATVFVFFGLIAVLGSYLLQTGVQPLNLTGSIINIAALMGFGASAIMLVNNLRDISTDKPAGKNTLAVKLGEKKSQILYLALIISPYLLVLNLQYLEGRYWWLALLSVIITPNLIKGIFIRKKQQLNQQLAQTASWLFLLSLSLCAAMLMNIFIV